MGESRPKNPEGPVNVDDLIASMKRETEAAIEDLERQRLEAELQRRRDYLVGLERNEKESLEEIRNNGY